MIHVSLCSAVGSTMCGGGYAEVSGPSSDMSDGSVLLVRSRMFCAVSLQVGQCFLVFMSTDDVVLLPT